MIGLFDSGLGGLTVLRRLRAILPEYDLLFFADQEHVPYGDRSIEELRALLRANLDVLDAEGCDAIVMACNTSCAIADRFGWPPTRALVVDLIESAAIAVERSGARNVGVLATAVTAHSGAYGRKIRARAPDVLVSEVAAPALVPLVEAGELDCARARTAVADACAQFPDGIEAIVLACTHFPLLDDRFAEVLPARVICIDPAVTHAERAGSIIAERGFARGSGATRYVTNGDRTAFDANVARIMHSPSSVALP